MIEDYRMPGKSEQSSSSSSPRLLHNWLNWLISLVDRITVDMHVSVQFVDGKLQLTE